MVSQLPTGFSSFQRWLGEPQLHARESAIPECSQVQTYAEDEALFFEDFTRPMSSWVCWERASAEKNLASLPVRVCLRSSACLRLRNRREARQRSPVAVCHDAPLPEPCLGTSMLPRAS